MNELDLYIQDFTDLSIWNAICDSVQLDGERVEHIIIRYESVKGFDNKGDEL